MKNVYALKKEKEVADDYLVKPFFKTVDDENFPYSTQVMKIITGVTGQGKTFYTATSFIPYLAKEKNVEIFVVSVPQTEILDKDDFIPTAIENGIFPTEDINTAINQAKNGLKVLLLTTHQSFVVSDKGSKLIKYLQTSGKQFAIFIDEAHTWLVSDAENYKAVTGHYGSKYEGTMFKNLEQLSFYSPYIFGLTATPNNEQFGNVETVGKMKFDVINKLPPKSLLIGKTAHLRNVEFYDASLLYNDDFSIVQLFQNAIVKLYAPASIKKTMMVSVGNKDATTGYNKSHVLHLSLNALFANGLVPEDEKSIALMTGDKKETGVYSINGSFEKLDEDEIKSKLNDHNDPLKIVIVVQKGNMGMNIFTLKSLFSFKPQDKTDKDGNALTEFAIQTLGRLVRLNTGMNKKIFAEKYNYDLNNYVKDLSKEKIIELLEANSIDIYIPDTQMFQEAVSIFKTSYVSSVQTAKLHFDNLK